MSEQDRAQHTFVVRVWRESAAGDWRASVEDVGSGHRLGGARLSDVTDFIVVRLDDGGPPAAFVDIPRPQQPPFPM